MGLLVCSSIPADLVALSVTISWWFINGVFLPAGGFCSSWRSFFSQNPRKTSREWNRNSVLSVGISFIEAEWMLLFIQGSEITVKCFYFHQITSTKALENPDWVLTYRTNKQEWIISSRWAAGTRSAFLLKRCPTCYPDEDVDPFGFCSVSLNINQRLPDAECFLIAT